MPLSLCELIPNENALESEKTRLLRALESELSLTFKSERRKNEIVAKLLGAADWNTLIGVVRRKKEHTTRPDVKVGALIVSYLENRFGMNAHGITSGLTEVMDEFVFDRHGTSQRVTDTINNNGLEAQLDSLVNPDIPVVTADTIHMLLKDEVWAIIKEIAGVTHKDVAAYMRDVCHTYGLCTLCGHAKQSGGFCQDVTCPHHKVNAEHEPRLTVNMVAKPDHSDTEFVFDASDYFYDLRLMSPDYIKEVMSKLKPNSFSVGRATENIMLSLEHDRHTLSKAKDFFLRDMHEDGFYCEIIEIENMHRIINQSS